jgi:hypothetical protein
LIRLIICRAPRRLTSRVESTHRTGCLASCCQSTPPRARRGPVYTPCSRRIPALDDARWMGESPGTCRYGLSQGQGHWDRTAAHRIAASHRRTASISSQRSSGKQNAQPSPRALGACDWGVLSARPYRAYPPLPSPDVLCFRLPGPVKRRLVPPLVPARPLYLY